MKRIILAILLVFLFANISAIRINEVEANPSGSDSGNEWVELYNHGDFDLSGYRLVNNDGDEIEIRGDFSSSNYYVFVLEKQWLDNTDEKVFLYEGDEVVDETGLFDDEENDDSTWQFCDGEWVFRDETEDGKNDCSKDEDKESEKEELVDNEEIIEDDFEESYVDYAEEEVIVLNSPVNSKDIKSEENKKSLDKSDYAFYGFIGFCILLVVLFAVRKRRFDKNEFA